MKKQKRISTEKPNTNKTTRIYVIYLVISRFEPCLLNILLQIIFYECTFENVTIKNCGDRLLFCCRRSHRWYHCFWCGWVLSQFWVIWNGAAQLPRPLCCCMSIEAARECRKTSSEMLLNCTNASAKLWARMRMKKKNQRFKRTNRSCIRQLIFFSTVVGIFHCVTPKAHRFCASLCLFAITLTKIIKPYALYGCNEQVNLAVENPTFEKKMYSPRNLATA